MSDRRLYVRLGGESLGPLSAAELRDLARRGGVTPSTPVSRDGVRWVEAAKVRGLTLPAVPAGMLIAAAAVVPPPIPADELRTSTEAAPASASPGPLLLLAALACGGLLLVLGCGCLGVYLAAGPDSVSAAAGDASTPPDPTAEQLVAQQTLAYWRAFGQVGKSEPDLAAGKNSPDGRLRMAAAARRVSKRLRSLPSAGVDPDAVACALEMAGALDRLAGFAERTGSSTFVMEAFVRGANGDSWGASADVFAEAGELKRRIDAAGRRIGETRALLSTRHGVEFPAFNP